MQEISVASGEVRPPLSDEFITALTRALADRGLLAFVWDGESVPNFVDTGALLEQ
jgi:hypothetical protein